MAKLKNIKSYNFLTGFITLCLLLACGIADSQNEEGSASYPCLTDVENEPEVGEPVDYAYVQSATVWKDSEGNTADKVFVCWENPSEENVDERKWVEEAIANTWAKESALTFKGWQQCAQRNKGIRILINDSQPQTQGLGNQLDEVINGMILNFTFKNWKSYIIEYSEEEPSEEGKSPEERKPTAIAFESCDSSDNSTNWRRICIENIAMHEFGHALGFTHEHNRPDTDQDCRSQQLIDPWHQFDTQVLGNSENYAVIGEYDPESIMNYCHNIYVKDLQLSELDKEGVQCVYGKP